MEELFVVIFVATIAIMRIGVWLIPEKDIIFLGNVIHHYVFGILLIFVSLLLHDWQQVVVMAVGTGLVVDEFGFFIIGGKKDKEYWSISAMVISAVVALALVIALLLS